MQDYLKHNQQSFEKAAAEYQQRWKKYLGHQDKVLKPLEDRLRGQFSSSIKVLDAGCGVGLDLYILASHGFKTYGFDFSSQMAGYAQQNSPSSVVLALDFFDPDLLKKFRAEDKFEGIVMDAFLHLFPKTDVPKVLDRVKSLLVPGGYGLITTTQHNRSQEGYLQKKDYATIVKRYRRLWTKDELLQILQENGLKVVDFYNDHEPNFNKTWMNVIFQYVAK